MKTLTHFLTNRGFHSELNIMLNSYIYARRNNLNFQLVSTFWVYGRWEDYFKPIPGCRHVDVTDGRLLTLSDDNIPCWLFNGTTSEELTTELTSTLPVTLEEKRSVMQEIIQYTDSFRTAVERLTLSLNLPPVYCALLVRRGDKITEAKYYAMDDYLKMIPQDVYTDIFIMTDDYDVISEYTGPMKKHHLVEPTERGFFLSYTKHADSKDSYTFDRMTPGEKYNHVVKLVASQDICARAGTFVTTFSANTSRFVYLKATGDVHSLDWSSWNPY